MLKHPVDQGVGQGQQLCLLLSIRVALPRGGRRWIADDLRGRGWRLSYRISVKYLLHFGGRHGGRGARLRSYKKDPFKRCSTKADYRFASSPGVWPQTGTQMPRGRSKLKSPSHAFSRPSGSVGIRLVLEGSHLFTGHTAATIPGSLSVDSTFH